MRKIIMSSLNLKLGKLKNEAINNISASLNKLVN